MYERVIEYCRQQGITVCEFERRCGLSNGSVGKWRNGRGPSVKSLTKVVSSTGIEITYWIGDTHD